jgi:isopentenyl-diphosphate delta-isomerase
MEMMNVVDALDRVVATVPKTEIYAKKLMHRIVHVLLFDEAGRMALQLRSKTVSFCPGHWSTTVGGHVQAGESYRQAADRESQEEIGVVLDVTSVGTFQFEGAGLHKFLGVFKATYAGPFHPDPKAVTSVDYFTMQEIQAMIDRGEQFHPELLFLLKKQFGLHA